ncbi:hypothetical protein C7S18_23305 [Ahniella affigens]|uniref:HTH luxR-type domain-containing protein n=1 Tax=Ahniella affigens TaxID=2021234 RepID=A0A2P1PYJ9_9GAMM|nr:helix-turn-helix transcriptional regulator [Ahniella affigens]AVP99922.1 hypothetical protein C7S18_23305 [Ahniella affigens]
MKSHQDTPTEAQAPTVVFVRMLNAILRRGVVQTVERIPNTLVHAGCFAEYRQLSGMQRTTIDLLVTDAFGAEAFLDRLDRQRCSIPKRTLLVAIGKPPLIMHHYRHGPACGWVDLDQPSERIESALMKSVTCDHGRDFRCQGCFIRRPESALEQHLSPKELAIFAMISEGIGPDEIANKLGVSTKTIETHRARIKNKLGLRNRQDLVVAAVAWRLGLFEKTTHLISMLREGDDASDVRANADLTAIGS